MDLITDLVVAFLSVVAGIALVYGIGRVLIEIGSTLLRGTRRSKLRRYYSFSALSPDSSEASSGASDTSSEPSRHDAR